MALSHSRLRSISRYLEEHFLEGGETLGSAASGKSAARKQSDTLGSDLLYDITSDITEAPGKEKAAIDRDAGLLQDRVSRNLADVVANPEETFTRALFRLIHEKDADAVAVYKRAGIDRKHFSKIRSNEDYSPKKPTVLALAIALRLNLDETLDLLGRAGYTLSRSSKLDLIIEYFIDAKVWDFFEINEALAAYEQPLLNAG